MFFKSKDGFSPLAKKRTQYNTVLASYASANGISLNSISWCSFISLVILFILGLDVYSAVAMKVPDNDAYFLIATGREILKNRAVPTTNIWTWHEGFSIIVQQWIPCVINALVYDNFGVIGMLGLTLTLLTVLFIVLYRYISLYVNGDFLPGCMRGLVLGIVSLICFPLYTTRPQIFSAIFIILELTALEKFSRLKELTLTSYMAFTLKMAVISLFEINFHCSMWFMLFLIAAAYIVPKVCEIPQKSEISRVLSYILTLVAMIMMGFLNPNGINGILYLYKASSSHYFGNMIQEMQPLTFSTYAIPVIVVALMFARQNLRNIKAAHVYLTLGLSLLSVMHMRSYWMIAIPMIILSSRWLSAYRLEKLDRYNVTWVLKPALVSVMLVFFGIYTQFATNEVFTTSAVTYVDPLLDNLSGYDKDDIRLFNGYGEGDYIEMQGYKVYIDARAEAYMKNINGKDDIYSEYSNVLYGYDPKEPLNVFDYGRFIDKYNFTHILVTVNSRMAIHMQSDDRFHLMEKNKMYMLYERNGFAD